MNGTLACILVVHAVPSDAANARVMKRITDAIKKTSNNVADTIWRNKGTIAVGTVATVALTNPEATVAAVTGTADVAYAAITGGTADTVAPRTSARPSTTGNGSTFSTLLFYLVMIGIVFIVLKYLLRGAVRKALPLLVVGLLLCFGTTAEASMLSSIPDIQCSAPVLVKPIAHFIVLLVTVASIFL